MMRTLNHTAWLALLLAGCGGGGGSDETAVSASPPAATPAPVAASPGPSPAPAVQTPTQTPIVPPGKIPEAAVPVSAPVAQPPTDSPPSVDGMTVWAALQTGISPDPVSSSPYSNYRRVFGNGGAYYLGGAYTSYIVTSGFPGASGIGIWDGVSVSMVGSSGVIDAVVANGITLTGLQLDLRNVDPLLDATAGTWSNGQWFASLVIQSQGDLLRVCWNVHLPPPPPVTGPPGYVPLVREADFRRIQCGVYAGSRDVGGYIRDDFNGAVRTYSGTW